MDTYRVRKGDSVGNVAAQHGVNPEHIIKANRLKDDATLKTGQVISIPDAGFADQGSYEDLVNQVQEKAKAAIKGIDTGSIGEEAMGMINWLKDNFKSVQSSIQGAPTPGQHGGFANTVDNTWVSDTEMVGNKPQHPANFGKPVKVPNTDIYDIVYDPVKKRFHKAPREELAGANSQYLTPDQALKARVTPPEGKPQFYGGDATNVSTVPKNVEPLTLQEKHNIGRAGALRQYISTDDEVALDNFADSIVGRQLSEAVLNHDANVAGIAQAEFDKFTGASKQGASNEELPWLKTKM